jgi:hypothetical protein
MELFLHGRIVSSSTIFLIHHIYQADVKMKSFIRFDIKSVLISCRVLYNFIVCFHYKHLDRRIQTSPPEASTGGRPELDLEEVTRSAGVAMGCGPGTFCGKRRRKV